MELFCFASRSEENIRLGTEHRKWAVATVGNPQMRGRITKAQKYLKVGSRGILYCKPLQSLATPFIVESTADPHTVVKDIWSEPWVLPFAIKPLGSLEKKIHKDDAWLCSLIQRRSHKMNITAAMNITGVTVFVPIEITDDDWAVFLERLAN